MASVIYDRPIILDSTGQEIVDKLDSIANSMDNAIIESNIVDGNKIELISIIPLGGVELSSKKAIIKSIKSLILV